MVSTKAALNEGHRSLLYTFLCAVIMDIKYFINFS